MINLNVLESLRTKEELLNYFKEIGQSITEEEIEKLKKSYEKADQTKNALTLKQLDEVAGGVRFYLKTGFWERLACCLPHRWEPYLTPVKSTESQPGTQIEINGEIHNLNEHQTRAVLEGRNITDLPEPILNNLHDIHKGLCKYYGVESNFADGHVINVIGNFMGTSMIHFTSGKEGKEFVLAPHNGVLKFTSHMDDNTYLLENRHNQHFALHDGNLLPGHEYPNGITFYQHEGQGICIHNNNVYNVTSRVGDDTYLLQNANNQHFALHDGNLLPGHEYPNGITFYQHEGKEIYFDNNDVYNVTSRVGDDTYLLQNANNQHFALHDGNLLPGHEYPNGITVYELEGRGICIHNNDVYNVTSRVGDDTYLLQNANNQHFALHDGNLFERHDYPNGITVYELEGQGIFIHNNDVYNVTSHVGNDTYLLESEHHQHFALYGGNLLQGFKYPHGVTFYERRGQRIYIHNNDVYNVKDCVGINTYSLQNANNQHFALHDGNLLPGHEYPNGITFYQHEGKEIYFDNNDVYNVTSRVGDDTYLLQNANNQHFALHDGNLLPGHQYPNGITVYELEGQGIFIHNNDVYNVTSHVCNDTYLLESEYHQHFALYGGNLLQGFQYPRGVTFYEREGQRIFIHNNDVYNVVDRIGDDTYSLTREGLIYKLYEGVLCQEREDKLFIDPEDLSSIVDPEIRFFIDENTLKQMRVLKGNDLSIGAVFALKDFPMNQIFREISYSCNGSSVKGYITTINGQLYLTHDYNSTAYFRLDWNHSANYFLNNVTSENGYRLLKLPDKTVLLNSKNFKIVQFLDGSINYFLGKATINGQKRYVVILANKAYYANEKTRTENGRLEKYFQYDIDGKKYMVKRVKRVKSQAKRNKKLRKKA